MTITIDLSRRAATVLGIAALTLGGAGLTGCQKYNDQRGKGDAPVGAFNDGPADVTNFPNGFGNVATKCSGQPGKRIWMATHGGAARTFTIESDESCK